MLSNDQSIIDSLKIATLATYWRERCTGDGWPQRSAIQPWDLVNLLPNMLVSDVYRASGHVYYRLVGTRVVEMSRFDFTGRWLHEMQPAAQESGIWHQAYALVRSSAAPVYGRTGIPIATGSEVLVQEEFAIFPVSLGDSDADRFQCIALEDYGDILDVDPDALRPMRPMQSGNR